MDYTTNYQLPVWAETDRILMDDFNDMTGTLEEALSGLRDDVDANTSGLSANTTAHAGFGNCQLYLLSYTGTGTSNCSFSVPGNPIAFMALGGGGAVWGIRGGGTGVNVYGNGTSCSVSVTVANQSISWQTTYAAATICNLSGTSYRLLVLLEK